MPPQLSTLTGLTKLGLSDYRMVFSVEEVHVLLLRLTGGLRRGGAASGGPRGVACRALTESAAGALLLLPGGPREQWGWRMWRAQVGAALLRLTEGTDEQRVRTVKCPTAGMEVA